MINILNYINGKFAEPVSGRYFENFNPSTGKVFSLVPDSDERDVAVAASAAQDAFHSWSGTRKEDRSEILLKLAKLIELNFEKFAKAETADTGKPLWLTRKVDIPRAISNFQFFATAILHFASEAHTMEKSALNYTIRSPLGVVGCISPWNLPLYLFSWKIAPALAAGNCVVAKPSEITPYSAFLLAELCNEAGLPPGTLNIIHGYGNKAGAAIVAHPSIRAISFTGGTKTGIEIAKTAAPVFKKVSLELGGKNPNIIFADCNFEKAVDSSVKSSFSNQGEICLCGSRILIEKPIYEKFKTCFVERTKQIKTGDPSDDNNFMGAIVSKEHFEKILFYIELAQKEGGTILCGGKPVVMKNEFRGGWFLEPTILEGLSYDCRTNQEEIFGPVVTLMPFESEEEAVKKANSTRYGLSSTIWTENLSRAHRISQQVETGIVWVNCWLLRDLRTPFGGMKQSGAGREGGWEAFRFFTEPKNVCIKL